MIVVEGPDGAGKSYLCKQICDEFGLKMGERETKDRDYIYQTTRRDSFKAMYTELLASEPPLVWDRIGFISDPIYSSIQDRPCAFTPAEMFLYRRMVTQFGLPLILCLPEYETVLANAIREHQMEGVKENLTEIYEEYALSSNDEVVTRYDYIHDDFGSIYHRVHQFLGQRKDREACASYSTSAQSR